MAGFFVSPEIRISEFDLTTGIPQQSTTIGALAGVFRWGPLERRVLVDSETTLWARFGKPTNFNPETFFTGASFLAYADSLYIGRAANTTGVSPIVNATAASGNGTITASNTSLLALGMIMISSNNAKVANGTTIASIINSTSFTVDSASHVTGTGATQLQFVSNTSVFTAVGNTAQVSNLEAQIVKNGDDFITKEGTFDSDVSYVARYPGAMGNSLRVTICDSANAFVETINLASIANGGATIAMNVSTNTALVTVTYNHATTNAAAQTAVEAAASGFQGDFQVTDFIQFGNNSIGTQALKITAFEATSSNVNTTVAVATFVIDFEEELRLVANQNLSNTVTRFWEWFALDAQAPGQSEYILAYGNGAAQDELHLVVVDEGGLFTGVPGTVLESYKNLSRATDAKSLDGTTNYYKTVVNQISKYVYIVNDRVAGYSNTALNVASVANNDPQSIQLGFGYNGSDEGTISIGCLANAYDLFASAEDVDVSLVLAGKARGGLSGEQIPNYIIDNICEDRKDCVVFISPDYFDVVNTPGNEVDNIVEFRDNLRTSSYAFLDSGYKYMYDRYNDVYRYIPMNGDMAGLAVRTDLTNDPWWSFAGYNRGHIKNVVKLAWNPRKAYRDALYKADINPVITQPGQGTLLLGDKTLLGKESAFSRIGVRRLFITIEKAIATASKFFLFELNDDFTRALFRNMIIPYMRGIQGRRGVYDFMVVCDGTNNTPEVIDSWTMIGDIYVKPERSINYIQLNFVAVKTGANFQEIVGAFR